MSNFNVSPCGASGMVLAMSLVFTVVFAFRYIRLIVGIWANMTVKPTPVSEFPTFLPKNVTVVVPTTYKTPDELVGCLTCIHQNSPHEVFIVTGNTNVAACKSLVSANSFPNTTVLGVEKLNKRCQMLTALKEVTTPITVFADDDVFWPTGYLTQLLAIFENPNVGAGGTLQKVRRNSPSAFVPTNFWNILGISYLTRRVFNNITTNAVDGSISTLSGRTAAYRTCILNTQMFAYYFTHDTWMGKPLNSDDDKCLTRYVYSSGWEIALQTSISLVTTVENNSDYLKQCLRWARAHWRGNFTVMMNESYWCSSKFSWGCYVIYASMFTTPSLFVDLLIVSLLALSTGTCSPATRAWAFALYAVFLFASKVVKNISHFAKHPVDMVWIPAMIAFAYFHGFLNIYALATMTNTVWGGQANVVSPTAHDTYGDLAPATLEGSSSDSDSESSKNVAKTHTL